MSAPYKLGFKQAPDPRDAQYPLSAMMRADAEVPISKSWKTGEVVNQLQTSACVGFSCWQFQVSEPVVFGVVPLSPMEIYNEARKNDEWPDNDGDVDSGTSVRAGLETLRRHGVISNYFWSNNLEEAVHHLLTVGPLVLGVSWRDSMFYPNADGLIQAVGNPAGGHAIFCPSAQWEDKCVTLQNSWGEDWGIGGKCRLSFYDLEMLLQEGGVCAAVKE